MSSDVYPYYLRQGDKASPTEPYVFGQPVDLVEVPVTWGLDDFPPFEFVWGMNPDLTSTSDIEEIWLGIVTGMAALPWVRRLTHRARRTLAELEFADPLAPRAAADEERDRR